MEKLMHWYGSCSTQVRASIWFTVCNFILKGIAFITVPIFARVLSTEEYGTVTIYNSFQQVLMILATFEFSLGAYNRGILKYAGKVRDYTTAILLLSTFFTFVSFLIVYIFRNVFINLTDTNTIILCLTYLMFCFFPAYNCWLARKRFEFDYRRAVFVTVLYAVTTTFLPLGVTLVKQYGTVKITAMLVVQILFCMPFYFKDARIDRKEKKFYIDVFKHTIPYQIPLVFHGLSFLILGQADRIMIGSMIGKREAAIYSVAYSVGQTISLFQVSLNQVFQPYRFKKMSTCDFKNIRKVTNFLLVFIVSIIIVFIMVVPEVMKLLFSAEYSAAIYLLPPITTSIFFIFLYSIFSDVEAYYNKTSYIMYASLIAAGLNILLNYIGIKLFGYQVCAYTTLMCYIILSMIHLACVKIIRKKNNIVEEIYDVKFAILLSGFVVLFSVLVTMIYDRVVIRYMAVALIALIAFIKRDHILVCIQKSSEVF